MRRFDAASHANRCSLLVTLLLMAGVATITGCSGSAQTSPAQTPSGAAQPSANPPASPVIVAPTQAPPSLALVATGSHAVERLRMDAGELSVIWAEYRNVGTTAAYLLLPNSTGHDIPLAEYTLYDAAGLVLGTGSFLLFDPQIVEPGQLVYFFDYNHDVSSTDIARVEMNSNPDFVELGDPAIAFTVSNLKIDKAADTADGIVKNDSVSYAGMPWVYVVYFDENGHPMDTGGCSGGCVPSLLPGQSARWHTPLGWSNGAATVKIFVSAHWFGPRP